MVHAKENGLIISHVGPGILSPAAKLTDGMVREIKKRIKNKESRKEIAKDYPVGESAIGEIKAGRSWSHIR